MNFKLIKRAIKFWFQRRIRGWDDSETWSLDFSLAKLILPRLKRFKELTIGVPASLTEEQWNEYLDDMIFAFEFLADENSLPEMVPERVRNGLDLFARWYRNLWW